ncbi:MAG: AEC family transporter [Actinobacteria bacterium]|nr:MAG: AEC family transporter [Actinomycetota bacterium]
MSFSVLAVAIAKLLALVGVGVALRATGLVKREHAKALNAVIVYVALPAMIFRVVYQAPLSWEVVRVGGIALGTSLVCFAVAWALARSLRLPRGTEGGFMIVAAIGNTGYIGYPVTQMLLGELALSRAVFYDVFGTVVMLCTVAIAVAARFGDHEEERVSVVRELFTFPAMVALLAALAARLVPWPQAVETPVRDWLVLAGTMVVPLIMISLGLTLSAEGFRSAPVALGASAGVKLALSPAIALMAALLLGEHESLRLVVLQGSMPSAMLPLVIGERFGLDTEFIASAILTTTVLCVVTIPLVQLLLR